MRKFSSYGPVNTNSHYYAPRTELLERAYTQMVGENPDEGGHYITVWAPRQAGKTWIMNQTLFRLREDPRFDVVSFPLEDVKTETSVEVVVAHIAQKILEKLGKPLETFTTRKNFEDIFKGGVLDKPLILILDEFDALCEEAISRLVGMFRNIYLQRQNDPRPSAHKEYLLHGVALIGVRSVLGIENRRGSPFNVQRSLHIPNLTYAEVDGLFKWYERESGQAVEQIVIDRLYEELKGQPGLTCWFGELLTEGFDEYKPPKDRPIGLDTFKQVYAAATQILPNANILNIISKAREEPYNELVLKMFQTNKKIGFAFDDAIMNFLYLNGVLEREQMGEHYYVKFPSPFIQKRLFNYFARELFSYMGKVYDFLENLDEIITAQTLHIRPLMRRYESHLAANREWLLKDAPRRADLHIYEAVYHFNLYMYLTEFLHGYGGRVYPEFPTGNGKIDLIIYYAGKMYGLEVKSFSTPTEYREALMQAAQYGQQLGLDEIALIVFADVLNDAIRRQYEVDWRDPATGVTVMPVFVQTGK